MSSPNDNNILLNSPNLVAYFNNAFAADSAVDDETYKRLTITIVPDNDLDYGFEILQTSDDESRPESGPSYIVSSILYKSTAWNANLRDGDLVLRINDTDVRSLSSDEIQTMIQYSKYSLNGQLKLCIERKTTEPLEIQQLEVEDKREANVEIVHEREKQNGKIELVENGSCEEKEEEPVREHGEWDTQDSVSYSRIWVLTRKVFNLSICGTLVGLLVFIFIVVILHPKCEPLPQVEWWQNALVYRINLDKFCDKSLDRNLCFKKLTDNVGYFVSLSANAVLLSNVVDQARGFKKINHQYGTVGDFTRLLNGFKASSIKVLIDFIPNYTTDDCDWFELSKANDGEFRDYYVWSNHQPNNWIDFTNSPAWSLYNNSYYLHQFGKTKPDLNFRNPHVYDMVLDSIEYWLSLGVDGMNLIGIPYAFEDVYLRNETNIEEPAKLYSDQKHEHTRDQRETFHLVAQIKHLFAKASKNSTAQKVLMLDWKNVTHSTDDVVAKYYGTSELSGFDLIQLQPFDNPNVNPNIHLDDNVSKHYSSQNSTVQDEPRAAWTLPIELLNQLTDKKLITSLFSASFFLPGAHVVEFDEAFYERRSVLNQQNTTDINLTEQLLIELSTIRSKSKSIRLGHTKLSFQNDFLGYWRYATPETNYAFFFNRNAHLSYDLSLITRDFKLSNINANILMSNIDENFNSNRYSSTKSNIPFNSQSIPEKPFRITPKSFILISWPFQVPDIKDIL